VTILIAIQGRRPAGRLEVTPPCCFERLQDGLEAPVAPASFFFPFAPIMVTFMTVQFIAVGVHVSLKSHVMAFVALDIFGVL
jgi:hypothetical protein